MNGEEQILTERQVFAMRICMIFFLMCSVFGGCKYINERLKIENNHIIEELAEKVIEDYLELEPGSIDLTPESPER